MQHSGFFRYAAVALLALSVCGYAEARTKKTKSKAKEETSAPAPKKTPYQKLVGKKSIEKVEGFITLYRDSDKIWMELPDSLLGREVLLSNMVTASSGTYNPWRDISEKKIYTMERNDSVVVFKSAQHPLDVSPAPVDLTFPIKYRNTDSTAVLVNIAKVFEPSRKPVAHITGSLGGGMSSIVSNRYEKDKSILHKLVGFSNSVGVSRQAAMVLVTSVMGFSSDVPASMEMTTLLTLLPGASLPAKEVERGIGSRSVSVQVFDPDKGLDTKNYMSRFNLDRTGTIRVYVDTLLAPELAAAAKEAVEAWNPAFEKAGLGAAVEVMDLCPEVNVLDPLVSVIKASRGADSDIAGFMYSRPDGEILSFRINIPDGIQSGIGERACFGLADVDPRFGAYIIPMDAMADLVRSQVMNLFGRCIGLLSNPAASYAYSPEQLRDPEFTSAHGLSSSVMDDVVFNYLARPGDKERGVKLFHDAIGEYDYAAIACVYGGGKPGADCPLYIAPKSPAEDVRCASGMLGNDPLAAFEARLSHAKYAAEHLAEWYSDSPIQEESLAVIPERLWLEYFRACNSLSSCFGGLMLGDVWDSPNSAPKAVPVPEALQRKAMDAIIDAAADFQWFDGNKELILMTGANKNTVFMRYSNLMQALGITRIPHLLYAESLGSKYTAREHMNRIQKLFLSDLNSSRMSDDWDQLVEMYLRTLVSFSPITVANYNRAIDKTGIYEEIEGVDIMVSAASIPSVYGYDSRLIFYNALVDAERMLKNAAAAAPDSTTREKISYLAAIATMALNGK